jgi:ElaB/YqjD/DUF883 family membrane-anchored ribosome-binding protein
MKITKKAVKKKLNTLLDKAADAKTRKKVRAEVGRSLKQGQAALQRLQKELSSPAAKAKAAEQVKRAKAAYKHLKAEAAKNRRKATAYAKQNPEKALIIAAAAGAAAGALLALLRRKR